jgi:hypothetical protein
MSDLSDLPGNPELEALYDQAAAARAAEETQKATPNVASRASNPVQSIPEVLDSVAVLSADGLSPSELHNQLLKNPVHEALAQPKFQHEHRSYAPMQTTARPDDPAQLKIVGCRSCGESHDTIGFAELNVPTPPYTHFFSCPVTGDPVMLALLQGPAGGLVAVNTDILRDLVLAQATGKYMVCVFRLDGKDDQGRPIVKLERKGIDFPPASLDTAVEILREIADHVNGRERAQPLPRANAPKRPALNLFPGITGRKAE